MIVLLMVLLLVYPISVTVTLKHFRALTLLSYSQLVVAMNPV